MVANRLPLGHYLVIMVIKNRQKSLKITLAYEKKTLI
jgi:hypothetical protein